MPKKRKHFVFSLGLAFVGVLLLGVDKLTASADSLNSFGQSFTIFTVVGLLVLLIAAIWIYRISFNN
jgi:hypothetical protein